MRNLHCLVLHFLDWCYTWTAPLSANQNQVIFLCISFEIKLFTPVQGTAAKWLVHWTKTVKVWALVGGSVLS